MIALNTWRRADPEYDPVHPRYEATWDGETVGTPASRGMTFTHNDLAQDGTIVVDNAADTAKHRSGKRYVFRPL